MFPSQQLRPLFQMSEDESALRQMMRLRGFSLMTNIMDDYEKDLEVLMLVCVFFSVFFRVVN